MELKVLTSTAVKTSTAEPHNIKYSDTNVKKLCKSITQDPKCPRSALQTVVQRLLRKVISRSNLLVDLNYIK